MSRRFSFTDLGSDQDANRAMWKHSSGEEHPLEVCEVDDRGDYVRRYEFTRAEARDLAFFIFQKLTEDIEDG